MMRDVLLILIAMAMAVVAFVFIVYTAAAPRVQRIDCTWSEISPDFTPAMREACRKARQQ